MAKVPLNTSHNRTWAGLSFYIYKDGAFKRHSSNLRYIK